MKPAIDHDYLGKAPQYFANARTEILPLLPDFSPHVLELGCGSGATLKWLKANRYCSHTCGVELFKDAAALARDGVDIVINGDIESMELDLAANHFDLILCLDVLEHLVDPWRVMQRLVGYLKPGGTIIVSIPNIRNWRALLPLLFAGRWEYADTGILDRTHLRFFTRHSALALVQGSGVQLRAMHRLPLATSPKSRIANLATLGLFKEFLTLQYLIAAEK
jgi:2-polyprenyl-3-methyl-5-hydroxy-6-metoxy-1,4-benzoquinol methylase